MSLPAAKNIPFDTLRTLFRIGAKPGCDFVRYRLPRAMLVHRGWEDSKAFSMVDPDGEEGVLRLNELLALALPSIEHIGELENAKEAAERRADKAESWMLANQEELKDLRLQKYGYELYERLYGDE